MLLIVEHLQKEQVPSVIVGLIVLTNGFHLLGKLGRGKLVSILETELSNVVSCLTTATTALGLTSRLAIA